MKRSMSWMLFLGLTSACGGNAATPPAEYPPAPAQTESSAPAETTPAEPPAPPTPLPVPVSVVAGENTPIEGATPTVRITAPRDGARIARGPVRLTVQVSNWSLAADPGQHLHLIIDNEPYIAIRDVSQPLDLNALSEQHLGHPLAEGTHVVRIFPGRAQHESAKTEGAFASLTFSLGQPTRGFVSGLRDPLLTFSRPKGCSVLGQRVLLDFYVSNATLSETGHKVRYTIDGEITGEIAAWTPHFIENLLPGQHTIRLSLLSPDGLLVPGPFNDTTRTITVAETCPGPTPVDPHAGH